MTLSLLLTALFTIVFAGLGSASAATGNEVKLLHAQHYLYIGPNSAILGKLNGSIEVENIAYHKQINVIWRSWSSKYSAVGPWQTTAAAYAAPTEGNFEAWEFNIPNIGGFTWQYPASYNVEFYIEYVVNGISYVDNNGGTNYFLAGQNYSPVILNKPAAKMGEVAFGTNSNFKGFVNLKNLAYNKDVQVVYTTDNWVSVLTAPAQFSEMVYNSGNQLEKWTFDVPVNANVKKVEMAVKYTVNGITYWDTNYGNRNYIIQR